MKKTISFGKYAVSSKRRVNEITVEIELTEKQGKPCFSVCGSIWNAGHTDIISGGQCDDEINDIICHAAVEKAKVDLWKRIYGLWKRNHLNDLDASANEAQRNAVNEFLKNHAYDYDKVCECLKSKRLFTVTVGGRKCKYGYDWYYRPIAEEDLNDIMRIFSYTICWKNK